MAAIGSLTLDCNGSTSVAFWLDSKARSSVDRKLDNGWTVSIRSQQDVAVATSRQTAATVEAQIAAARDAIEETLDVICFRLNDPLKLKPLNTDYFVVTQQNGKRVLTYRTVLQWKMNAGPFFVTITDATGKAVNSANEKPTWQPVLRYYRLSQTRDDIFDAYRYMFLAFEALLFSLWPITTAPKENEGDWLLRAVGELAKRINLIPYVPTVTSDLPRAFVESQYAKVRLPLFHAKKSSVTLPHEGLDEEAVVGAYSRLVRLVRNGLNEFYSMRGQSAVLTNYVFQTTLTKIFQNENLRVAYCQDDTPFDENDDRFSPKNLAFISFDKMEFEPETNSSSRLLSASVALTPGMPKSSIYRIGLIEGMKHKVCSVINTPINLEGIDEFRFELMFSFVNLNTPKWA